MAIIIIPYSSFIEHWGAKDDECTEWLNENVGQQGFFWKVENCEYLEEHARFWFWRDDDAMAFKLRWL